MDDIRGLREQICTHYGIDTATLPPFDRHGDTMTLLLFGWSSEALRLVLSLVISLVLDAPANPNDEDTSRLSTTPFHLPPLPMVLGATDTRFTTTLAAALRRFAAAQAPDSLLLAEWRRALLLLLIPQCVAFRELLWAHSPTTDYVFRTRVPRRAKLLLFMDAFPPHAMAFASAAGEVRDPIHFVKTVQAIWLMGTPHYL